MRRYTRRQEDGRLSAALSVAPRISQISRNFPGLRNRELMLCFGSRVISHEET